MQIKITTPKELEDERTKLVRKLVDLLNLHARSEKRYATRMNNLLYKVKKLEKLLEGRI